MVNRTLVHHMMVAWSAKTAATLPVFNKSETEYYGGCTIDGEKAERPNHCNHYHMVANPRQNSHAERFVNHLS